MKAPKSERSLWLSRTSWAFFAVWVLDSLIDLIVGGNRLTQHNWQFWALGVPLAALWLGVLIAYLMSRLNDAWDEEARERRAESRRTPNWRYSSR